MDILILILSAVYTDKLTDSIAWNEFYALQRNKTTATTTEIDENHKQKDGKRKETETEANDKKITSENLRLKFNISYILTSFYT